jgi:hypothetical protein
VLFLPRKLKTGNAKKINSTVKYNYNNLQNFIKQSKPGTTLLNKKIIYNSASRNSRVGKFNLFVLSIKNMLKYPNISKRPLPIKYISKKKTSKRRLYNLKKTKFFKELNTQTFTKRFYTKNLFNSYFKSNSHVKKYLETKTLSTQNDNSISIKYNYKIKILKTKLSLKSKKHLTNLNLMKINYSLQALSNPVNSNFIKLLSFKFLSNLEPFN